MRTDVYATRSAGYRADVLRLTPLEHGIPDHARALTLAPEEPVVLSVAALYWAPNFLPLADRHPNPMKELRGALQTDREHLGIPAVAAAVEAFHAHGETGMSVEVWTHARVGSWHYALMPSWQPDPLDDWPLEEEPGTVTHTVGKVRPNPLYAFPRQAPLPHPAPMDRHFYWRVGLTATPPPAALAAEPLTSGRLA